MPSRLYALCTKQLGGDDALFQLFQTRLAAAGLQPEFNPPAFDPLERELTFNPHPGRRVSVHLPRPLRLSEKADREVVAAFAARYGEQADVMVVHDQPEIELDLNAYVACVRDLDRRLRESSRSPVVHIEYAAGLPTDLYIDLIRAVRDCPRVSSCIDISHIGIRQAQRAFKALRPHDEDVTTYKRHHPGLKDRIDDVKAACKTALPEVCKAVAEIAALGKPLHFHLHDGSPASTDSQYGVSDHLSFFHEIMLPFEDRGGRLMPLLFGPLGLQKILQTARAATSDELLTFTIEVHCQTRKSLDLGEHAGLFAHWQDKGNAEKTNHWIETLVRCANLVREVVG